MHLPAASHHTRNTTCTLVGRIQTTAHPPGSPTRYAAMPIACGAASVLCRANEIPQLPFCSNSWQFDRFACTFTCFCSSAGSRQISQQGFGSIQKQA